LNVTGVDFSPAALAAARVNLKRHGLSIDLREGNLLSLPFTDASFPFVNCWGVLMHIPQLELALDELIRVLKPGGRLSLAENSCKSLHVRIWEPFVIFVKRLLGKKTPRRDLLPQGIEEWRDEGLMIRKTNIDWLKSFMASRGMLLISHDSGHFTEIYTAMPSAFVKRLIYRFNYWWFRRRGSPTLAMGQILIFEKSC
jgi:ubiquinone/menaquinone biosynthesis C-methylase UbiE